MRARLSGSDAQARGGKEKGTHLRRTTTEGVGMLSPSVDFNVERAAWKLFDPEDRGHILAEDLYRVCNQLGKKRSAMTLCLVQHTHMIARATYDPLVFVRH